MPDEKPTHSFSRSEAQICEAIEFWMKEKEDFQCAEINLVIVEKPLNVGGTPTRVVVAHGTGSPALPDKPVTVDPAYIEEEVGVFFHRPSDMAGNVVMISDWPANPSDHTIMVRHYKTGRRTKK